MIELPSNTSLDQIAVKFIDRDNQPSLDQLNYPLDPNTQKLIGQISGSGSSSAYASGNGSGNTTITNGFIPVKIPIATNNFATGITYDSVNTRYKIVTAGKYLAIGFVFFSNPTQANKSYQSMVYKNGSVVVTGYGVPPATGIASGFPAVNIISCVVGDYIELYSQTGATADQTAVGGSSYLSLALM